MTDRPNCPECDDCDCYDEQDFLVDRDTDDETGYDPADPKHPTFHERYADAADLEDVA